MVVHSIIPALLRLRQKDLEFLVRPCLKKKKKKKESGHKNQLKGSNLIGQCAQPLEIELKRPLKIWLMLCGYTLKGKLFPLPS
jgi:hypothetical protein